MELLREVRKVGELANIISIRQKRQLGLGHAILCAKEVIRDEAFAVILGDDLLFSSVPGIKQLIDVAETENMAVVGVMPVERSKVNRYGILNAEEIGPHIYRVRDLQEKPRVEEAASNLAVIGRYVLTPEIFYHLEKVFDPDQGGELELTEGLRRLAKENKLLAVRLHGMRFDVGHWVDYLIANIYFSLQDEELRDDVIKKTQGANTLFLRFVLIFLCVLLPVNIFGKPPDINEIITNVQTQYKGLVSFDIGVNFPSINASTIVYRYVQKGSDVRILWGKNINGTVDCFMYGRVTNGKVIEDAPIIPLILEDFINLDKELDSMGIEKDNIYFDYVDHIPCFVIGGLDKIYVDIENFAIRKRVAHGKEYIFRDFVHIGNYFFTK